MPEVGPLGLQLVIGKTTSGAITVLQVMLAVELMWIGLFLTLMSTNGSSK